MTKSKIFSSALRAKSYQDDVRATPLIKLSTGQKRKSATSARIEKGALTVPGQLPARSLAMVETKQTKPKLSMTQL